MLGKSSSYYLARGKRLLCDTASDACCPKLLALPSSFRERSFLGTVYWLQQSPALA